MDNLTHGLVGALLGQAGLKRRTGLAMPALIVGANLPDIDAACFFWLDGVEHLGVRRGITHGPIAWVLLPLVLAALLLAFDRWQARRGRRPDTRPQVHFGWLYALSFLACLTHPALDWLNTYGIRLLEPFSSRWFYGDILFIIDVWVWVLLIGATWLSLRRERRGLEWRRPARIALSVLLGYVGLNAAITYNAEQDDIGNLAVRETVALPPPVAFWRRDLVFVHDDGLHRAGNQFGLRQVGEVPLSSCRLNALARRDADTAAYLFWSRAPFVRRLDDGTLRLSDARFDDPRFDDTGASDRFAVILPAGTCGPEAGR